jgi:hypothetical protein
MNKLYKLLVLLCLFIGCLQNEKKDTIEIQKFSENINEEMAIELQINNIFLEKIIQNKVTNITDFFFIEIMNGNKDLTFHRDEYKIIEHFGEPLKVNIQPVSFNFSGGKVVELHEYIYDDFVHYYYIFENESIFYNGFIIENGLERLKTINIGDTLDKLLSTFSDKYYLQENIIIYYTDPVICEIRFIFKDEIINKIFVNYLLI